MATAMVRDLDGRKRYVEEKKKLNDQEKHSLIVKAFEEYKAKSHAIPLDTPYSRFLEMDHALWQHYLAVEREVRSS